MIDILDLEMPQNIHVQQYMLIFYLIIPKNQYWKTRWLSVFIQFREEFHRVATTKMCLCRWNTMKCQLKHFISTTVQHIFRVFLWNCFLQSIDYRLCIPVLWGKKRIKKYELKLSFFGPHSKLCVTPLRWLALL